jgi:hypothetical protein
MCVARSRHPCVRQREASFLVQLAEAVATCGDSRVTSVFPPVARIIAEHPRVWRFPAFVTADEVRKPLDRGRGGGDHGLMALDLDASYGLRKCTLVERCKG